MVNSFEGTENPIFREEDIVFNIIYVENTVETLLPFIYTLIAESGCGYRLVSNACTVAEEAVLKKLAETNERLTFYSLETAEILPHHVVLHQLLEIENNDCFAFMDSDIVAKAPFLPAILKALENKLAVFTGLPLWHEPEEMNMPKDFNIMGGRFPHSHHNKLLGLSYAAIYKTEPLRQFMKASGVDLRKYRWQEIEPEYQKRLVALELDKMLYDTAKLLNILWQDQGAQMAFEDSKDLIHLGGVSGPAARPKTSIHKTLLSKMLPRPLIHSLKTMFLNAPRINKRERLNIERLVQKRKLSEQIAFKYLNGTISNIHEFDIDFLSDELLKKIESGLDKVKEVTDTHYPSQLLNVKG